MNGRRGFLQDATVRASVVLLACHAAAAGAQDGVLDPAFGNGGIVEIPWPAGYAEANAVAIDSSGRIAVCGYAPNSAGDADFALFRLLMDGSLDLSYASDSAGIRLFDFKLDGIGGRSNDLANDVATLDDNSIVAAGEAHFGLVSSQYALIKTDATGKLDATFGDDGSAHFGFDTFNDLDQGMLLRIDESGRILVAGNSITIVIGTASVDYRIGFTRLTPQGQLDSIFARYSAPLWGDKSTIPPTLSVYNFPSAILLDSSQRIVVAGSFYDPFPQDVGLWRESPDGAFDLTFGPQAIARTRLQLANGTAGGVTALAGGKLMTSGTFGASSPDTPFLMRLNEDGSPDTSFASDGLATAATIDSSHFISFNFLAPTKAGGWLLAGQYSSIDGVPPAGEILVRFDSNGVPDASFGDNGIVTIVPDPERPFFAHRAALQADGKLVIAGSFPNSAADTTHHFAVLRILADYDTLFVSGFDPAP
jgi:uncharacterized delta-60 repeat protein